MYCITEYSSPVGGLTLASDGESLTGLWIDGQKYHGSAIYGAMPKNDALPVFTAAKNWLGRYFAGLKPAASELPLAPAGGEFRAGVWDILCSIPYGEVITYGDIAKRIAQKINRESMSAQAVGGAVGHNPISIIIPCHRVVGANGSLTGYAAGIEVKRKLLSHEGAYVSRKKVAVL
ncbi:MAG: methylated-DNA--[protein]-cysteine S-methyltransferase [Oscillospiraceae bacterium]|jgi:methylated-DNA-[protein]-cysteine S-methyltransferase|nr:methylated-DNA--[protein]-cysteine S-methyltransferase [Oscillospiraceae bacterium]